MGIIGKNDVEINLGNLDGKHSEVSATFNGMLQSQTADPDEIWTLVNSKKETDSLLSYSATVDDKTYDEIYDWLETKRNPEKS